ncbi:MAG: hypothetical protein JJU00_05355 [Opitutales bacterium]|nr:hypothetical protein [Opitutales bacterium]
MRKSGETGPAEGQAAPENRRRARRRGSAASLVAFGALIAGGLGWLAWHDFEVESLLDTLRATNPLVFLGLMTVLPLVGFPIAVFYLYAGTAFSWPLAWGLCVAALALNMAAAYVLGVRMLRRPVSDWLSAHGYEIPALRETGHFRLVFIVRAVPAFPFPVQNYLLALAGTPFGLYLVLSLAIQATFAAGMTAVPALLLDPTHRNLFIAAGVVVILAIGHICLRLRGRGHGRR